MKTFSVRTVYITNLPILISCAAAAWWVWYYGRTGESAALFLGIIAGGLVDMDDRLQGRLRNLFFTLLHFSLASFAVQLLFPHPALFALMMVAAAFFLTMAGALDARYRTIAFGTLLVMLYNVLTYLPGVPLYTNPLVLLCGTLLYSLCTVVLYLIFPHRPVQEKLADAYRQLADYMAVKARFFDPDEADNVGQEEIALAMANGAVIRAFNACRSALYYRMRSQHLSPRTKKLLRCYLAVQTLHERISARHVDYRTFARDMAYTDLIFRFHRLILLQADCCRAMASALRLNNDFVCDPKLARADAGLRASLARYEAAHPQHTDHHLHRLADNLLAISSRIGGLAELHPDSVRSSSEEHRIAGTDVDRIRDIIPALAAHLTFKSGIFRHAVRMACITAVVCLLIDTFHMHMGYWILLTALLVCQPNYSATKTRLKQRIAGTLLGVLAGSVIPYFVPTLEGKLLVMVISVTLFYFFRSRRYSFSTFFITVQVIVGFSIIGIDTQSALLPRFTDTVIGAFIAWAAVSFLWPDWNYLTLKKTATAALAGDAGYLQSILKQLETVHSDDIAYRTARRIAHEKAAALGNVVSDMSVEAGKYADQLPEALSLLQLNYSLISNISAIGSLRRQEEDSDMSDIPNDYGDLPATGELATNALYKAAAGDPEADRLCGLLEDRLAQIRPSHDAGNTQQVVLWTQLQRISETLKRYRLQLNRQI